MGAVAEAGTRARCRGPLGPSVLAQALMGVAGPGPGMRSALLVLAAALALLATAPPAAAINACAGTSDGVAQVCLDVDWDDPAACARLDAEAPWGHAGTGACVGS